MERTFNLEHRRHGPNTASGALTMRTIRLTALSNTFERRRFARWLLNLCNARWHCYLLKLHSQSCVDTASALPRLSGQDRRRFSIEVSSRKSVEVALSWSTINPTVVFVVTVVCHVTARRHVIKTENYLAVFRFERMTAVRVGISGNPRKNAWPILAQRTLGVAISLLDWQVYVGVPSY